MKTNKEYDAYDQALVAFGFDPDTYDPRIDGMVFVEPNDDHSHIKVKEHTTLTKHR